MSPTLALALDLIARPSLTPEDAGCQAVIAERLRRCGFQVEPMRFGAVENLWARRGRAAPLLVFAGHSDVVPPGPTGKWRTPPFEPAIVDGVLYGRGAADMKGSLAAMVTAAERFVALHPEHRGSIGFLVTSDEEGPAVDGTRKVVETLNRRGEPIDWCIIGEPSSEHQTADVVKIGRRGSLNATLHIQGRQGHVAYPSRAANAIHLALPVLSELVATRWDEGNAGFPPTSFQISNIGAGTGAENVIPGELEVRFNLRYSTECTAAGLQERIEALLQRHGLDYRCEWQVSGEPFLCRRGVLLSTVQAAIRHIAGIEARASTSGGTSDGRFMAPTGTELLELGPLNATIHQVDERVGVAALETLSAIYEDTLRRLLAA
ncbi:MAG: succinyl-diaminopimelate desuccinylase [Gammaproteobacteria bacterium]